MKENNFEQEVQIEDSIEGIEKVKEAETFRGDEFMVDLNPKKVIEARYIKLPVGTKPKYSYYWRPKYKAYLYLKTKKGEYVLDDNAQSQFFTRVEGINSRSTPSMIEKGELTVEELRKAIKRINARDGIRFYYTKKAVDGQFAQLEGEVEMKQVHAVVGNQHIRIPHIDAVKLVVGEVTQAGIQIEGGIKVSRHKSTVKMSMMFNKKKEVKEVGDVVQAGIEITNDKEGRCSLYAKPLILRLACLNGMVRNSAGAKDKIGIHIGDRKKLLDGLRIQVKRYISDLFTIELEIMRANKIQLDQDTMIAVAEKLFKRQNLDSHKYSVVSIIKRGEHGAEIKTAWGLVNALTGYATHGGVSDLQKETINKLANMVLDCKDKEEILELVKDDDDNDEGEKVVVTTP